MPSPDDNLKDELSAPPRLVAGLRRASQRPELFIPRSVDEAVLRASRGHLEKPGRTVWSFRRWAVGLSTATAILAVTLVSWWRSDQVALAREDVNRDGRVDIVDALVLAQAVGRGAGALDLNGDRRVDGHDVVLVANKAVKLHPGS